MVCPLSMLLFHVNVGPVEQNCQFCRSEILERNQWHMKETGDILRLIG